MYFHCCGQKSFVANPLQDTDNGFSLQQSASSPNCTSGGQNRGRQQRRRSSSNKLLLRDSSLCASTAAASQTCTSGPPEKRVSVSLLCIGCQNAIAIIIPLLPAFIRTAASGEPLPNDGRLGKDQLQQDWENFVFIWCQRISRQQRQVSRNQRVQFTT